MNVLITGATAGIGRAAALALAAQGAQLICSNSEVPGVSGRYFANCAEKQPRRWALDDDAAERLWRFSEDAVAFKYPGIVGAST